MGLTLAAIKRPIWVVMLMILALVLGWLGLRSMPVEQNPEVEFPYISIFTSYPGASPEEVETEITRKIEDAVSSLPRLQQISSSSSEGISAVLLEFTLGTRLDSALTDSISKVNEIIGNLPRDAERPVVSKLNIAGEPILYVAVESDSLTPLQLRDLVDDRVKDRLARISGVAEITVVGGQQREIRIAIDKGRLLSYRIGINDVLEEIRAATINIPGGRITEGARETGVRVLGEFTSVEQIKNLVIPIQDFQNPNNPPAIVLLKDIAEITDGPAERTTFSRVNGRDAVIVTVQKTREGNAVEITENAKKAFDELSKIYPIKFTITRESAKQIKESLEDLEYALIFGIFLVVSIIYLFLHNLRGTFIVSLAIPTCLFAAFAVMSALGFTMNTMTMLGLSLALGILVDDAIVVLENTYRHLTMGEPPREAAFNGRMEIGLAALSITLVDVAVFLPIAFMGGITGEFMRPFAVTVAVATLFSLLVSFTLTPMLASRWYRKGENLEDKRGFAKKFDEVLHAFTRGYQKLLGWALKRRFFVFFGGFAFLMGVFMMVGGSFAKSLPEAIAGTIPPAIFFLFVSFIVLLISTIFFRRFNLRILFGGAMFGGVLILFSALGFFLGQNKGGPILNFTFFPPIETGSISASIEMPPGSSLDRTLEAVKRVEEAAMTIPEVNYVTSRVGSGAAVGLGGTTQGSQYASININLIEKKALVDSIMFWKKDEKLRTRSQNAIITELQQKIGKVPDAKIVVSGGSAFGPGGGQIQMAVTSLNPELVPAAAEKMKNIISQIEGVVNVELSSKPGKPELRVIPDRVRLADNDLSVQQLGGVTRTLYEGNTDAKYREKGREYDIRINLKDDVKNDSTALESMPITFRQNNPIFLGDVATIERASGPDKVERVDRQRQITVGAYLLPGYIVGTVTNEIYKALADVSLGEGVAYKPLGEAEVMAREQQYLGQAFMLAIIFVFFVLAALFDNILYPFIIQLAQPQALVGAMLALMIVGRAFDIVGFIAIIMLVGLVGKNAILLVDFTNTLRERGVERTQALIQSGGTRMRPILMTTLALVLAMVPIALALGRGSEFRQPLGIIIIGGMTLSTILTLFVIPCSYTIFDDLSSWIGKTMRRFVRRPEKEEPQNDLGSFPTDGESGEVSPKETPKIDV